MRGGIDSNIAFEQDRNLAKPERKILKDSRNISLFEGRHLSNGLRGARKQGALEGVHQQREVHVGCCTRLLMQFNCERKRGALEGSIIINTEGFGVKKDLT